MTLEQKIVLDLLGQTLFAVPFSSDNYKDEEINWDAVFAEAKKQTVVPTTVEAVPGEADRSLRLKWIDEAYQFEKSGYRVLKAHAQVSQIIKTSGIPFVTIKGASSGSYYPQMHTRKYGDVDLLVAPENIEALKNLLLENGFNLGSELPFEFSMFKDSVSFDVHQEISGVPAGECGKYISLLLEDTIESASRCIVAGVEIPVPSDFHHGIIQLLHTSKHMIGFGAGLRQLCDWAVLANHMGKDFSAVFEEKLKASGLWTLALVMSAASVKYLHMPSYDWIQGIDSELVDRFMDDLMRKGNLAHDGQDDMDSVFIAETNKGGVGGQNMFIQMLKNIAGKVCYQWPYMKTHKILIPFGIFWMCVRYCYGVITGSYKKTDLKGTIAKANMRKNLYQDLGLFSEAENEHDK